MQNKLQWNNIFMQHQFLYLFSLSNNLLNFFSLSRLNVYKLIPSNLNDEEYSEEETMHRFQKLHWACKSSFVIYKGILVVVEMCILDICWIVRSLMNLGDRTSSNVPSWNDRIFEIDSSQCNSPVFGNAISVLS